MSEETLKTCSISRHFDTRGMRGQEVDAQRGEKSKTFQLGKGIYQSVIYPERVHYQDATGNWRDIDNRLRRAAGNQPALETTSGPLRMRMAGLADADPLATIEDDHQHTLCWRLEGAAYLNSALSVQWKCTTTMSAFFAADWISLRIRLRYAPFDT